MWGTSTRWEPKNLCLRLLAIEVPHYKIKIAYPTKKQGLNLYSVGKSKGRYILGRGKHFKTDKEFSRERELSHKNKELQREVARLRRELDRQKPPEFDIKGQLEKKQAEAKKPKPRDRTCYSCGKGKLQIKKFWKPDGEHYKRTCNICDHSTRAKKVTPEVEE